MKRKLQKQMDSMMETTMDAITNNTKLAPLLNELFKYAPKDEKTQFILLHEIANQYLHELLDIDSEFHDYSFEEGIKICIEEKVDYLKERFQICTIETYKGLIETLKHEEYQESIFDKGDIIYTQKDEDNRWFSYTVPRPMEPERYNTILVNDSNLIDYFKNMDDSDLELAIDMDYMMVPTNDKGFERPINPLAYIVFDLRNDQILHFDLIHPDQEDYEVIMNNFLGAIEHFGKPKHVYARNPYILNWLDFICEKLEIPLVEDDLEEIDDIFNMLKHMDME
jgi:hypothetical protein